MPSPTIPKFRIPLQMQNGRLALVEQDSQDNVAGCVYALLSYERGSRVEDPDFGVEDPTFSQLPFDTQEWLEQIHRYEPRAGVATSEEAFDLIDTILVEVGASP